MKLLTSFSLNMLNGEEHCFTHRRISFESARNLLLRYGVESCVGSPGLANILSQMLNLDILPVTKHIQIMPGEQIVVAHYLGYPPAPSAINLPIGSKIIWRTIRVTNEVTASATADGMALAI